MAISLGIYYFTFGIGNNEYNIYYQILMLEIVGNIIDISWFFQGLEEFKKINPNCCQFTKSAAENYTHPDYNGFIKMEYVTFYGEEKDFSQVNHFYIAYDSCGNLHHRYLRY